MVTVQVAGSPNATTKTRLCSRGFPLVPHFEEFSPVLAEPCQLLTLTICCFSAHILMNIHSPCVGAKLRAHFLVLGTFPYFKGLLVFELVVKNW